MIMFPEDLAYYGMQLLSSAGLLMCHSRCLFNELPGTKGFFHIAHIEDCAGFCPCCSASHVVCHIQLNSESASHKHYTHRVSHLCSRRHDFWCFSSTCFPINYSRQLLTLQLLIYDMLWILMTTKKFLHTCSILPMYLITIFISNDDITHVTECF